MAWYLVWAALLPAALFGASREQNLLRHLHDNVEMMRYELRSHEEEIRMLQEKVRNQEETITFLRQELDASREMAARYQESHLKELTGDIQKLRAHANESSSAFEDYQKKISEMEKKIVGHQENIAHLKEAMRSLTDVLHEDKTDISIGGFTLYSVKPGDSLGVIAQKYNTTIKEIKALNDLKGNTIIIGQKLKIPER